jgi:uncharacterized phage-associated protein
MISQALSAHNVADYFLAKTGDEAGLPITQLVLQKLLYYAQGFHLALQGEPLFEDAIVAWKHGPVVPGIYQTYRRWRKHPIGRPDLDGLNVGDTLAPEALDMVQAVYGQIPAWKLSALTHVGPPWIKTRRGAVIQHELLKEFFLALVTAGKTGDAVSDEPVWPTNSLRHQRRKEIMRRLAPSREKLRRILDRVPSPDPWAGDDED